MTKKSQNLILLHLDETWVTFYSVRNKLQNVQDEKLKSFFDSWSVH